MALKETAEEVVKKVVEMKFESASFEDAMSQTLSLLERLEKTLDNTDQSAQNLQNLERAAQNLTSLAFPSLASNVEQVAAAFTKMGTIGMTITANLTNRIVDLAMKFVSKIGDMVSAVYGFQAMSDGFQEYELKMGSIQTILTNTADKGTTLTEVTDALDELNHYADKTIYNFAEMTRNIGTFTAAGVDLGDAVSAIKGISNLAAGVGSTPVQAATAMYQLSQALAAGAVTLQDWNSVVNAGMGGQYFQKALEQTAKELAEARGLTVKTFEGTFRESISGQGGTGWLTSEVLLETLKKFAEDPVLLEAATKVKTFTGLIDTMKESIGSGWAETWEIIIGNLDEASALFTPISQGFDAIVGGSAEARNELLKFWKANGGRDMAIKAMGTAFQNLTASMKPVKTAFSEAFPPMTGKRLVGLTEQILNFVSGLKLTKKKSEMLHTVSLKLFQSARIVLDMFSGVATTFNIIAKKVIPEAFGVFLNVVSAASDRFSGFIAWLEHFTGIDWRIPTMKDFENVGYAVCAMIDTLKERFISAKKSAGILFNSLAGGRVAEFFASVNGNVRNFLADLTLSKIVSNFKRAGDSVREFFDQFGLHIPTLKDFWGFLDTILTALFNFGDTFQNARKHVADFLGSLKIPEELKENFAELWLNKSLAKATSESADDIENSMSRINVAFSGVTKVIDKVFGVGKHIVEKLVEVFTPVLGMFIDGISQIMHSTQDMTIIDVLKVITVFMSHNMYATFADTIDAIRTLGTSITGIARNINKISNRVNKTIDDARVTLSALQAELNSRALINIAIAVTILAGALMLLSMTDMEKVQPALSVITLLMGEMLGAIALVSKVAKSMGELTINLGPILTISIATIILANALRVIGSLKLDELKIGIIGLSIIIAEIVGVSILLGKYGGGFGKGASTLIYLAFAVKILGGVIGQIGALNPAVAMRGLNVVASLLIVVGAVAAATQKGKFGAVGVGLSMLMMAHEIDILAQSVDALGSLDIDILQKGLLSLAALGMGVTALGLVLNKVPTAKLIVFGIGMQSMSVGLAAVATSAYIFSRFSWDSLKQAGIAMGAILAAFSISSLILNPITITALGGAMIALGIGFALLAADLNILAAIGLPGLLVGLGALAITLTGLGIAGLLLGPMLPVLAKLAATLLLFAAAIALLGIGATSLSVGLVALVPSITATALAIGTAIVLFIVSLIEGLADILRALTYGLDEIRDFLIAAGYNLIQVIVALGPDLTEAVVVLLIDFINGLAKYIYPLVVAFDNLCDKFMDALFYELLPSIGDWIWMLVVKVADLLLLAIQGFLSSIPVVGDMANKALSDLRSDMNKYWTGVIDDRRVKRAIERDARAAEEAAFEATKDVDFENIAKDGADSYSEAFLTRLSARSKMFQDSVENGAESAVLALEDSSTEAAEAIGNEVGLDFINSIENFKIDGTQAGLDLGNAFSDGLTSNLTESLGDFGAIMNEVGNAGGEGFINGLAEYAPFAGMASENLGTEAIESLYQSIDAHSPSVLATDAGRMLGEGFIDGINEYSTLAKNIADTLGQSALTGLNGNLYDGFDLDPTIKPVLDLSDVDQGLLWLRQQFAQNPDMGIRYHSPYNNQSANADYLAETAATETNNAEIISQLEALRDELSGLEDAITNLQVVLDSGELVGSITDETDRQLGRKTRQSMRGVL